MEENRGNKKTEDDGMSFMLWGLIFGPTMGMTLSIIFDGDMAMWMAMGSGIGIGIGALLDLLKSKEDENEDKKDDSECWND